MCRLPKDIFYLNKLIMKQKKIALITGASSGIGAEIAIVLARQNFNICINFSKSVNKAKTVKDIIEKNGGMAIIYRADITKESQVKKMFNYINDTFGLLDVLVNNAGIYSPDFIENYSHTNWQKIINTNLCGKILCTKYAVPLLKKSFFPKIINIASRSATKPSRESSAYCCAASAIVMLSKVSALELEKYNIKVNTISPGLTKTNMTKSICSTMEFENYINDNPSHRIGLPSDVANVVSFLVSEKADFINGENINVSGGIILK